MSISEDKQRRDVSVGSSQSDPLHTTNIVPNQEYRKRHEKTQTMRILVKPTLESLTYQVCVLIPTGRGREKRDPNGG